MAFSETWLTENSHSLYELKDYNMESNSRSGKKGGGVCIYIYNSIDYQLRTDLDVFNDIVETKFLEIEKDYFGTSQNVVVGVIYRPPNTDLVKFNDFFSDLLCKLRAENKLVYLLGDYNINILSAETHTMSGEFLEIMFSNMFVPLINKPTRVGKTSATIIDNILTNSKHFDSCLSGIFYTDISDHFPVFYIDNSLSISDDDTYIIKRSYSARNVENFKNDLSAMIWDEVLTIEDPQSAYTLFFKKLSDAYNKCFPLKKVKGKYYNRKPWLTECLKQSIKRKNKLHAKYKRYPNFYNESTYANYQRILQKSLRFAEREYYDSKFMQYKNDLVKSWKVLKEVINRRKKSKCSAKFLIDNKIVNNENDIAENFD